MRIAVWCFEASRANQSLIVCSQPLVEQTMMKATLGSISTWNSRREKPTKPELVKVRTTLCLYPRRLLQHVRMNELKRPRGLPSRKTTGGIDSCVWACVCVDNPSLACVSPFQKGASQGCIKSKKQVPRSKSYLNALPYADTDRCTRSNVMVSKSTIESQRVINRLIPEWPYTPFINIYFGVLNTSKWRLKTFRVSV